MRLYELAAAYRSAAERLEDEERLLEEDGVVPDDSMRAVLDTIEDGVETKVENCMVMAKEWEAEAEALKEEEGRLAKRRKALENRADRLRGYVKDSLIVAGLQKLKTRLFSFTINKAKPSVVVDNIELVPELFLRVKKEPEKAAIKTYLEEGGNIPGVHLDPGKPSMTVR